MSRILESPQNVACVPSLCFALATSRSRSAHTKSSSSTTTDRQRYLNVDSPFHVHHQRKYQLSSMISTSNRSSSVPTSARKCKTNENLPPNILQLLRTSGEDPFASTEDE